jgi:hypothetical protein
MKKLLFPLILIIATFSAFADDAVIATGIGNSADEAKKNAFINAVEQSIGVMVSNEMLIENGDMIKDTIYTNSQGYIDNYTVVSSGRDGDTFVITIKAMVSRNKIQTKIEEISHLNDAKASYEESSCKWLTQDALMCSGGQISIFNMNYGIQASSYILLRYFVNFKRAEELMQIYIDISLSSPGGFYAAEDHLGNVWEVLPIYLGRNAASEAFALQTTDISYLKRFINTGLKIKFTGNKKTVNINIPAAYIEGYVKFIEDKSIELDKEMAETKTPQGSLYGQKIPFGMLEIYKRYMPDEAD